MFDKQARFRVGEFDGEKECAAGNEVSAITRHRILGLWFGCWRRNGLLFLGFSFVKFDVFRRPLRPSESASFNEVKS